MAIISQLLCRAETWTVHSVMDVKKRRRDKSPIDEDWDPSFADNKKMKINFFFCSLRKL